MSIPVFCKPWLIQPFSFQTKNSTNYWSLLNYLFSPREAANAAGLSYVRVPLGASDFAAKGSILMLPFWPFLIFSYLAYSYDDVNGDTCLKEFDITKAPSYVFSVLLDIISVNQGTLWFQCVDIHLFANILPAVKVHLVPWSPVSDGYFECNFRVFKIWLQPAWMKTSGTMNGGTLKPTMINLCNLCFSDSKVRCRCKIIQTQRILSKRCKALSVKASTLMRFLSRTNRSTQIQHFLHQC